MKKDANYKLKITGNGSQGEGVAKFDKYVCFIPGAVEGDEISASVIKVKGNIVHMKLTEVITPSPFRISPPCEHFSSCGGCTLLNTTYEKQLSVKSDKVYQSIKRIGKIDIIPEPIVGCNKKFNYRNKALIPVSCDENGKTIAGFYCGKSHDVLNIDDCLIQDKFVFPIVQTVRKWMDKFKIEPYREVDRSGTVRHIYFRRGIFTNEIMAGVVTFTKHLPFKDELVKMLTEEFESVRSVIHNINTSPTSILMGNETKLLFGTPYIEDIILNKRFRIGPLSFYQVNPTQVQKLYQMAIDLINPQKTDQIFDIYCGTGTIGLCLADKVKKVTGIEVVPEAVKYAKENAKLNNIKNAEFFIGKAEDKINDFKNSPEKPNIVILDPPRSGCDKRLLEAVCEMAPEKICYISCDAATLARDLNILCNIHNYNVNKIVPVDMFPQTSHTETIAILQKGAKL